jgi:DNA polymerase III gamma/tau subunit
MLGRARFEDIQILLKFILDGKTHDSLRKADELLGSGSDPFVLYRSLQSSLYKTIVDKTTDASKVEYSLSNLLYIWQIFLRQTENMKDSDYPEHILNAAIIIMSHTSSFPKIEDLMIDKVEEMPGDKVQIANNDSNNLINNVLNKFPGATVSEIE